MKNVNESDMVQYDIRNVTFTSSATESGQDWTPSKTIYLNEALCDVHAYYPYNKDVTNIEAIPVESSTQTDYMYAGNTIQVNAENRRATLEMEHALSVITLTIKKGSYTGAGNISKVGLRGSGIAKAAKLNGKTGELADITGADEMLCQDVTMTMDESGQAVHTLFVPNPVTSNVKISLWVDGNEYYVITPGTLFDQGYRYEYTLTVDEGSLDISAVHVGDWGYDQLGNPVLWAGNHRVTLQGDLDQLVFKNAVTDGVVSIEAKPFADLWVPTEVTATEGATLTKKIAPNNGAISLHLSEITSDITVTLRGHAVTFTGEYGDITFNNSISGSIVTIEALAKEDYYQPSTVTVTGSASVNQSVSDKVRTITLTSIQSDLTVTFGGITYNNPWVYASDGVYYVSASGTPTLEADNSCIGVALIYTAKNLRLMIEKYENANNAESTTVYATAAQKLGSTNTDKFSWGSNGTDYDELINYTSADGTYGYGYLPSCTDGYYHWYAKGNGQISGTPTSWESGALSDFAGQSNSEVIKNITDNGTSSETTAPMAYLMNAFNDLDCPKSVNQGYRDWFIPSCGQLGVIMLSRAALNNALNAIGGTEIYNTVYWSSSEGDANNSWYIGANDGTTIGRPREYGLRVRLVRNL